MCSLGAVAFGLPGGLVHQATDHDSFKQYFSPAVAFYCFYRICSKESNRSGVSQFFRPNPSSSITNMRVRWNPDPHILRVEDTYYLAVSSFQVFPGVPIYESKDLANWELVSHALDVPEKVPLYGIRQDNGTPALSV